MYCFAVPLPLWATPPFLYIHTISSLLISFWRLLPVPYCLPCNTLGFRTSHKLGTKLLPLLYTILNPIIVPLLEHLFHSTPLLSFLTLLLSFSSTLVTLLVAWPCTLLKGAKGTISLAQAKDAVPGPNCMLKSLWG